MKTIRISILEDDLKTLAVIMDKLFRLEESLGIEEIKIAHSFLTKLQNRFNIK